MEQPVTTNASVESASVQSSSEQSTTPNSDSIGTPQPTVTESSVNNQPVTDSSMTKPPATESTESSIHDAKPTVEPSGNNVADHKTPDSAYGTKSSGSHSNIQFSFTNDDAMSTTNSTNTSSLMASPKSPRYVQRNPVTGSGFDDPRPRSRQSSRRGNK